MGLFLAKRLKVRISHQRVPWANSNSKLGLKPLERVMFRVANLKEEMLCVFDNVDLPRSFNPLQSDVHLKVQNFISYLTENSL
jgi:hypothetical protein